MQAPVIPLELAKQAAALNHFEGALRAWAFLAGKGYLPEQILAFLFNVEGTSIAATSA